jgi:hypothetical protein
VAGHALYLYGFVRSPARLPLPEKAVAGAPVRALEDGAIAALVGDLPVTTFEARREDLVAHSDVLQTVVASASVLPAGFGTVFTSEAELLDGFVRPHAEGLERMLDRMEGLVEVQVRAGYDEEVVAREVVASDRAIQRLQSRARSRGDVESKIELGRRFAEVLDRMRYADGKRIVDALAPLAAEVSVGDGAGEYGIVRASFLVARADLARVDAAVAEVQAGLGGRAALRCIGPVPPYSFVDASALGVR